MIRPLRLLLALSHRADQALNRRTQARGSYLMRERVDRVSTAWLERQQENQWRTR